MKRDEGRGIVKQEVTEVTEGTEGAWDVGILEWWNDGKVESENTE